MKPGKYPHIKRTKAKGKLYLYFRTGVFRSNGKEMLTPLPPMSDPGFGGAYASCLAGRSRRQNAETELTVPVLIQRYQSSAEFKRLSEGTQRLYGFGLKYLAEGLPTAPAGAIERRDVVLMRDKRAHTPGAANSLLRTIKALYNWGRERGLVTNDPGKDIKELPGGEHEPWPRHILDSALAAEDDRVRLATHLLLYTAQRIGDVVRMKWTDIKDGALTVTQQKTKRVLELPLHEKLKAELARHQQDLGYIIPGTKGRPITAAALRTSLQEFTAQHGAKRNPHGLRKNAVNELLESGCSAAEAGAISGQTMRIVEMYGLRRSQPGLAQNAMSKWSGNE